MTVQGRVPLRWHFAQCCFDESSLVLTVAGKPVELERRPLELLSLLLSHAGEVVTKTEILGALWAERDVTEASLTKCMARLRRALSDTETTIIHTVHGYGYRFAAPVLAENASSGLASLAAAIAFTPGEAVPRRPEWVFVERLGTGGHGDVWLAEHVRTRRRRVLKFATTGAGLAALRREISLGRLLREGLGERPDLAQILDWNLRETPYFLETRHAEHGNLAQWAERQGGLEAIALEMRLELAAQIADALAASHSMGVLHKDLKPANILMRLDEAGRPAILLTDFGSGRALDPARLDAFGITRLESDLTTAGSTAGTLMYRAPEISAGQIPTVQADLFALGVILFQIVAGDFRRGLAPGWEGAVADHLLRQDIAAASDGEPNRRLGGAAELARRLRTLPARREAQARAELVEAEAARTRRALELASARRLPVLALLGVLLLFSAVSTLLAIQATQAGRLARAAAARAQATSAFLTDDLFSAANPLLGADPNIPVRKVLDAAAAALDRRFPPGGKPASADNAAIEAALEAALGGAYAGLADAAHAAPLLRDALARLRTTLGDSDPQVETIRLAQADLDERVADLPALRAVGQEIVASHPSDAATLLRGRFAIEIADCLTSQNDSVCVAKLRPFLAETSAQLGARHPLTLRVQDLLAYQLSQGQRFPEALALGRETVRLTVAAFGADSVQCQERRYHLGQILVEAGQAPEAIAMLEDVRARLLRIFGHETDLSARAATQLGRAYTIGKRPEDGLAMLRLAMEYNLRSHGESYQATRFTMNGVAKTLAVLGRAKEAVPLGQRALYLQRQAEGPDNEDTLWMEGNLATETRLAGDIAGAEALYADAFRRAHATFRHGEWDLGHFGFDYAQILATEGKREQARQVLTETVAVFAASLGPEDSRTKAAKAALEAATP